MPAKARGDATVYSALRRQMGESTSLDDRSGGRAEPFDVLLAAAALGTPRRFFPGVAGAKLAWGLARRPGTVARRGWALAAELGRIAGGTSTIEPSPRDRRFTDPAWAGNPLLHRLAQAYLAGSESAEILLEDADLDWVSAQQMGFITENLVEAVAPSNFPLTNPQALKAAIDTGGRNFFRGAVNFLSDMSAPPRIPSMVDSTPYRLGENIAATPGAVVFRTEMFELLQYKPATDAVLSTPLLVVPPMINKFYVMDLAPGRSMVEFLVGQGVQVFMVSWRNPDARHRDWGLDRYGEAILSALDAVGRITGKEQAVLYGACSGGILAAMTAAHLQATGDSDRLAGLTLVVTVLDQSRAGLASSVVDRRTADAAAAVSARRGYLDGRTLAEVFAWLRPGDLIWNYWVNNYLLGRQPPAFDILFWNGDVTRMPAWLHRHFLEMSVENSLVKQGEAQLLGTPVDLSSVKTDAYVVAGVADHLCDWESCYRTADLLGGTTRFVLSTSGHIAAIVNPPGNPKAKYQVSERNPEDPKRFLKEAQQMDGSWWHDYADWLRERCGPEVSAPSELGGGGLEALAEAPGIFVLEK
jgi:poly[(R)-3-hydroxyalkanoate] polymerase subunit PhaC